MKVFIIEDEPLGIERLEKHLSEIDSRIEVLGNADSIKSSVQWLSEHPMPDLIFMDIELADGQSFSIFNKVRVTCPVIFTTSYDEYALQAFKVNSVDYLLKPIRKEELKQALQKFHQMKTFYNTGPVIDVQKLVAKLKEATSMNQFRTRFLVRQGQRLVSIETDEIAYFYTDDRVCFFKTWDKNKYIVDYNIEELEQTLDPRNFFRLNRAFIAHVRSIAQIHNFFNGKLKIELRPPIDREVLVSREKAQSFKDWMGR